MGGLWPSAPRGGEGAEGAKEPCASAWRDTCSDMKEWSDGARAWEVLGSERCHVVTVCECRRRAARSEEERGQKKEGGGLQPQIGSNHALCQLEF